MFRSAVRRLLLPLAFAASAFAAGDRIAVIASFTIAADLVRDVGGDTVTVRSVTPPYADLHVMQPTPSQVRDLAAADLVVAIHPELETWLSRLEKSGTLKRPVLYLAKDILGADARIHEDDDDRGHPDHGVVPHVWMNPDLTARMARTLAGRLAEIDHSGAAAHRAAGEACAARMRALDDDIARTLAIIPEERRTLITQHDNFGRFAEKFRLRVAGNILDSVSTEAADPSAKRLSGLIAKIRAEKIPAVFADNTLPPDLPATVAREAGLPPPVTLYTDALDLPGTPAGTYAGMMRENARRIAGALTQNAETRKN